jgi:hypothetical protein
MKVHDLVGWMRTGIENGPLEANGANLTSLTPAVTHRVRKKFA